MNALAELARQHRAMVERAGASLAEVHRQAVAPLAGLAEAQAVIHEAVCRPMADLRRAVDAMLAPLRAETARTAAAFEPAAGGPKLANVLPRLKAR